MIGIYKITSPTNRVYIGSSSNVKRRFSEYNKSKAKTQPRLHRSIVKHGLENHIFEIIEECDVDDLFIKERHWQEHYDVIGKMGLNCSYVKTKHKNGILNNLAKEKIRKRFLGVKKNYLNGNSVKLFNTNTGIYYDSIGHASYSINKNISFLRDRLTGKCVNNTGFIYADELKHDNYINNINIKNNKPKYIKTKNHICNIKKSIKINKTIFKGKHVIDLSTGVVFVSIREACFAYDLKYDTLKRYLSDRLTNKTNLKYL